MSRHGQRSITGTLVGLACLSLLGLCLWHYPAPLFLPSVLILLSLLLFWFRPLLIWLALPALLPLLDFSTWTGLLLYNEYDLLLLAALTTLYLRRSYRHPLASACKGNHALFSALVVLTLLTLLPTLLHTVTAAGLTAHSYLSPWNSLRVAKGLLYAWLLWPHLYQALKQHPQALRLLTLGCLIGVAFAGVEALWERGVLLALLQGESIYAPLHRLTDFSGLYRITGLFSTMLVGGAAIDAYLVALVPIALVCAITLKRQPQRLLAMSAAALGVYALLSTFSRASYAGLVIAMLLPAVVIFIRQWSNLRPQRWRVLGAILALVAVAATLYALFPYIGHRGMVITAVMSIAALMLGQLRLQSGLGYLLPLLLWPIGALLISDISSSSRWQQETGPLGYTSALLWTAVLIATTWLLGRQYRGWVSWLRMLESSAAISLLMVALVVSVGGNRMSVRLGDSLQDTLTRIQHWTTSVALREDSLVSRLLGEGPGSFPRLYYQDRITRPDRHSLASYQFHQDNLTAYLQLGSGDFSMAQRVRIKPDTDYTLRLQTRKTLDKKATIDIRLCPRRMLSFSRYQPQCLRQPIQTKAVGSWQEHEWQFNSGALGRYRPASAPVSLLLQNGAGQTIDVTALSLTENRSQHELIANGHFASQSDHWYLVSDFEHLAWHSKQMLIHVWLESGWLGLLIFTGLIALAFLRLYRRLLHQPCSLDLALLASLGGLLFLGLFGTLLDTPRLATVFYLLLLLGINNPVAGVPAHGKYLRGGLPPLALLLLLALTATAIAGWQVDQYLRSHYQRGLFAALTDIRHSIRLQDEALGFDYQQAYQQIRAQGKTAIRNDYPRILRPESQAAAFHHRLQALQDKGTSITSPCKLSKKLLNQFACWLTSSDESAALTVIEQLKKLKLTPVSEEGRYGNAWLMALIYDHIRSHPAWSSADDASLKQRIRTGTEDTLKLLDSGGASLWHGRATLAANAWIGAVVLDANHPNEGILQQRALAEFEGVLRALELTGGAWPESYNYWINSRAHAVALAGLAYVNSVEDAEKQHWARRILSDVGHWHIHGTRPDNRIEGFGDEGPRTDLKDETRRVIDLLATASRDPMLSDYSDYLGDLHRDSYYRAYRWSQALYQDPTLTPVRNTEGLAAFNRVLPTARLFGRDSSNHLSMRKDWPGEELFISYRASDHFSHHGDYAAGHFSLYAGEPLAVNSSVYTGGIFARNRLDYGLRSIAKNTLLIVRPGEIVHPNRFFEPNINAGGQRITLPTGSSLQSVDEWRENLHAGLHLDAATVLAYDHVPDEYTLISTDLTRAYNSVLFDDNDEGGKLESVIRHLLYLRRSQQILVYDQVRTTHAEYTPKWLLHSPTRPRADAITVLKGQADNGILETLTDTIDIVGERNHLQVQRLLPAQAISRLIGGKDYRYYVEIDGDDSTLDGRNIAEGAVDKPWFDPAYWRVEIAPGTPQRETEFLFVLTPSTSALAAQDIKASTRQADGSRQVQIGDTLIVFFNRQSQQQLSIEHRGPLLINGLPPSTELTLQRANGASRTVFSNAEGILYTELKHSGDATLRW